MKSADYLLISVFRTALGWMAMTGREERLSGVTFGYASATSARNRLATTDVVREGDWHPALKHRLQDYAEGAPVSFHDIDVELGATTPFTLAALESCRRIAYGETLSYGELARQVGAPGAARAVGNVMRSNRCPLVIPCHRVVHGDGRIGNFSAPQGASMKQRLLAMEIASRLISVPTLAVECASAHSRRRTVLV